MSRWYSARDDIKLSLPGIAVIIACSMISITLWSGVLREAHVTHTLPDTVFVPTPDSLTLNMLHACMAKLPPWLKP